MPSELIQWTCPACNRNGKAQVGRAVHCGCGFSQYHTPPKLGDRVAIALARVGITSSGVTRVKRAVGLGPCKCKERQQALNALGDHRSDTSAR